LTVTGILLLFSGYLLSYGCPIIKKIWSPSYVLVTCGLAYLFLVLLIWIVDINKVSKWSLPFQAFGTNPLFIYIIASLLACIFETPILGVAITASIYTALYHLIGIPKIASLIYALLYISMNGGIAYILYKKHIFIKI
jgi:predicted acyltransferase